MVFQQLCAGLSLLMLFLAAEHMYKWKVNWTGMSCLMKDKRRCLVQTVGEFEKEFGFKP